MTGTHPDSDPLYFQVDIPEAADLADLAVIREDVVDANVFLEDAIEHDAHLSSILNDPANSEPPFDDVLEQEIDRIVRALDAAWKAALITYRRAFASGRHVAAPGRPRTRLESLLDRLSPVERTLHDSVILHASRVIAHQVDAHSDGYVTACLSTEGTRRVLAVAGSRLTMGSSLGGHREIVREDEYRAIADLFDRVLDLVVELERPIEASLQLVLSSRLDWCYTEAARQSSEDFED